MIIAYVIFGAVLFRVQALGEELSKWVNYCAYYAVFRTALNPQLINILPTSACPLKAP